MLLRRLVLLAASLMACPGASALVMHGTRPAITHAAVWTATKGVAPPVRAGGRDVSHTGSNPGLADPIQVYYSRTYGPRLGQGRVAVRLRVQRPVATMRAVSAPFERSAEAIAVSVRKHYLEPFVVGVVIRGLFELLAEIEGRPSGGPQQWWPAALRSGGAKWWPRATRIPARWTCVAACVSLVDDYMFGAVGLVLGFLGSGRLMVMHAGSAGSAGP